MSQQDAQDLNQMMAGNPEVMIASPNKLKFLWVVLACVALGVGLGVVVYQQSIKAPVAPVKQPPKATVAPTPTPIPSPVLPETNVVTELPNTMTFPKTGKIRVFSNLNNIQLVVTIETAGQTKTLTLPGRTINAANLMNYSDSSFDVTAQSTGTIKVYQDSTAGSKMLGWRLPIDDKKCGANKQGFLEIANLIAWAQTHLATGETIFAKQCWADAKAEGDPTPYDFNDFFLAWSYAGTTTTAPSPSASATPSLTPSPTPSATPTSSPSLSPSPSPSLAASPTPTPTPTPTPSARAAMPDTTDGVPVTGIFEITAGTVSAGIVFLVLGLVGLLAL
ncbi:MAG: hypothetical protein WAV40_04455 [Microgenomates group bacterium]